MYIKPYTVSLLEINVHLTYYYDNISSRYEFDNFAGSVNKRLQQKSIHTQRNRHSKKLDFRGNEKNL